MRGVAIIFILWGIYALVRGRVLFIKKYNGVKNISLHSRIEGGAIFGAGLLILFAERLMIDQVLLIVLIMIIVVVAFVLEIILKAI